MSTSENSDLPLALTHLQAFTDRLRGKRLAVFLDYDGTLTPIVDTPEQALLTDAMRDTLRRLGEVCVLAIVSGRAMANVRQKVQLDELSYAGDHGFEIQTSSGDTIRHEQGEAFMEQVQSATALLEGKLAGIDGALVEPKKFSLSVHYRLVSDADFATVEQAVNEAVAAHDKLRLNHGKKVFEIRPKIDWHKGKAVLWLLEALKLGSDVLPLYVGDDTTDEDAFRALADNDRGMGVLVADAPRASAAHYRVRNVDEAQQFLEALIDLAKESN